MQQVNYTLWTKHHGTPQSQSCLRFLIFKILYKSKFCQSLRQYLVKKYLLDWQRSNDMLKDGKLVIYLFLKTNFGLEKYLTLVNNFNYKKSICRYRVSAHRLYIETGRYKNIPRNERLCKNCSANEIEDEAHFLIKCDKLNNKREENLFHQKWKISPNYLIIRNYIISYPAKIKKSYNLLVGFYMKTCLKLLLTNLIYFFFLLPCLNILIYILYICVCSYIVHITLLLYCYIYLSIKQLFPLYMCICSLACWPSRAIDWLIKYLIWNIWFVLVIEYNYHPKPFIL